MHHTTAKRSVMSFKALAGQTLAVTRAQNVDFLFLKLIHQDSNTPEFNGFNTSISRKQGQSVKPGTKAIYTPLIDMVPADPDTMMTAMVEAKRLTEETGQSFTIFTADQQLYRVVVDITWVYPDLFHDFIPRLGGMHFLMSFTPCRVGSVGSVSASRTVGREFASRPGHTKDHHKNGTNCLPA